MIKLIRLKRYRRGQVRGIDFTISIVIFLLTMTQILVLTNSFITANRSHLNQLENQGVVDSISGDILSNPGTANWVTITTSSIPSDWDFGLSSDYGISPYKLSRLSHRSLDSMVLDYDKIAEGLEIQNKTYQIEIYNTIKTSIIDINTAALPVTVIAGNVTQNQRPVNNAEVWIFTIDHTNYEISQAQATTNSSGVYSKTMNIINGAALSNTHITFIIIAKYGNSAQDTSIQRVTIGSPTNTIADDGKISIFENADSTSGYTVDVKTSRSTVDAVLTSFYPGIDTSTNNVTQIGLGGGVSAVYGGTNIWAYDDFLIPYSGLAVLLLLEIDNAGDVTHVGLFNFPTALDDNISNIIAPASIPNAVSSVSVQSIVVRGMIMNFKITIWEV